MLEAQKYSAKLVFKGAKEFSSDHLFGLLTDANTTMGLSTVDTTKNGDVTAQVTTEAANVAITSTFEGQETLLTLTLEAKTDRFSQDAMKAQLAGYLRDILGAFPCATDVEWLNTGARIPRADFLAALCPSAEMTRDQENTEMTVQTQTTTAQDNTIALLAPRRIEKAAKRSQRPAAGQHAKLKAIANAAIIQTRQQVKATGTDCFVPVSNEHLTCVLPTVDRRNRITAANDNTLQRFSAYDARLSLQEGSLRTVLKSEPSVADLEEAEKERGPIPVEARLSTWAVSLSIATVSLPVAAPVMIYNIARGEDMRVASLAMGLAGFFTALSGSGATAGILPF